MPVRKSQKAEREKAARELEELTDDEDNNFEELQKLQDKLYGSATSTCGSVQCKNRSGNPNMRLQCSRCKGQKYCNVQCQKADWVRFCGRVEI
ncbi:hypothetical protein FIBSPDRAFT_247321 [Athelia psychrophila]|uniref:MYND-type domain-containing protein n=1 Tax=Athelia psychrophila TaxID=1759441 RepID=A0A166RW92_9AGAM|nr:hypothetical protein FIBSPDRAFT_247321 [Fibularhizoctonia sp. CBS 109695]